MGERTAIVTGAARGIGAAISRRLARDGYRVLLADVEPLDLATVLDTDNDGHAAFVGDLSDPARANALIDDAIGRWGRLDVLVNNAGGGVIRPTLDHTAETLRTTIDRNLWTTIHCTLAAIEPMRAAGYGRVVNVGADSVRNGLPDHAIYNAAKGGVHAMARGLAREFATEGITFNTVAPSMVLTEDVEQWMVERPEFIQPFLDVIPMGRPAALEEVASAVAYLASEEASFITGQVLSVNGGANMG